MHEQVPDFTRNPRNNAGLYPEVSHLARFALIVQYMLEVLFEGVTKKNVEW